MSADWDNWTEKTAVEALIAIVEEYVRERTPPFAPCLELPDGLQLEIHPAVYNMLLRNLMPALTFAGEPLGRIPVPVRVNAELPEYTWRLVIITEDVINGGAMPRKG